MQVFLTLSFDQQAVATEARAAEDAGYDGLAAGEHLFFHGPHPNGFVALAAAAGATTRVRLLTSLTVLPLYPAALAAKLATTLDQVSGGRFDMGVGVGGEYPPEFEAAGVELAQRGARTDEALELLRALWRDGTVDFDGRFARVPGLALQPGPVQVGGPRSGSVGAAPPRSAARGGSPTSGCRTCTRPISWPRASPRCGPLPKRRAATRPASAVRCSAGAGPTPIPRSPAAR